MLLLGTDVPSVRELTSSLHAELVPVPDVAQLEAWREEVAAGAPVDAVVVAIWPATVSPATLTSLTDDVWLARAEDPLLRWPVALGAAVARCADGGSVVAVVDRPAPLDAAGWAPESAVADAVEALVRSLARSEGASGVRVNAVTTPARVAPSAPVAPAPALPTFPGSLDHEVLGAVRLLLSPDGSGLTGTVVHADCGRSWR